MRVRELIIVFGLVLSLALFGVIALLDAVVDPTDNTDKGIVERDLSGDEVGFIHLVRALSSTDSEGVAHLHLDGYDINELLYASRSKLSFGPLSARSIYLEKVGEGHRLCLPIALYGFETMLSGDIELYDEGGRDLCARISGLRVGKMPIDSGLLSFLNLKGTIVKMLSEQSITASWSEDVLNVRLTRENIGALVSEEIKKDPNASLINALYNLLLVRTDAVVFDIASPEDLNVTIDLGSFGARQDDSLTGVNSFTSDLLTRGVMGRDKVNLASKYYVNGYDRLTAEEQSAITELLSGEGDVSAHKGLIEREKISLVSLLLTQLENNTSYLLPGFKIADRDINALLSDHELVGTVFQFVNSRDSSCAFIAVREVYTTVSDDFINIHVDLDLNGYVITISVDFHTGESPLAAVTGQLGDTYIGGVKLDKSEVDLVFDFLCDQMKEGWIRADKEAGTITLDFSSAFQESPLLAALLSSPNIVTVCEKSLISGGYVQITFKLF